MSKELKLKLLYLFFVFGLLGGGRISHAQTTNYEISFTYKDFLDQKKIKLEIYILLKEKNYSMALLRCQDLKCERLLCKDKYYLVALCYLGLENHEKALDYLYQAVSCGYDIQNISSNYLGLQFHADSLDLKKAFERYLNVLDLELRKSILEKALSYHKESTQEKALFFDSVICIAGWPSIQKVGHQNMCNPSICSKKTGELYTSLSKEKQKTYLQMVIKECEKNNEDWTFVEYQMETDIRKKTHDEKMASLEYFVLNKENELDAEKSLLQLGAIANFINSQHKVIVLHSSVGISLTKWIKIINQLKTEFKKLGVKEEYIDYSLEQVREKEGLFFISIA